MEEPRKGTFTGRLARLGFSDVAAAGTSLEQAGFDAADDAHLVRACATAADPDRALAGLVRLLTALPADDRRADLRAALREDSGLRDRLVAVLGASAGLGDHLARHPADWRVLLGRDALRAPEPAQLRTALLYAVDADPYAHAPVAGAGADAARLHRAYRTRLLHLAARDLTGVTGFDAVAAELAELASATLEAALALARTETGDDATRLAIVGLGKCGGGELNYVSDVDVVFVTEADGDGDEAGTVTAATRLAAATMRTCSQGPDAPWQVDAALRPEGGAGPLVRTLASHFAYYRRWAKTWEFQALLKARPVAGDRILGHGYVDAVAPLIWEAAGRDHFVEDVQAMRRRVEDHVPPEQADRQLKLGPGGLRDVEFAVQLLQLVHGRTDPALRVPGTLAALSALGAGGYVGRDDAATLAEAYRFLRGTEHLLQLDRLRRTQVLPDDEAALRRLGRALHLTDGGAPATAFTGRWRRHAREVRRIHEKLFYRPLLRAVARLPGEEARLTEADARARLEALGYADPGGALGHIQALTSGVTRRAAIQRTLLPVLLGWFADAADPDAGLLGFRRVSDALGRTPWYLRLLRDDVTVARRLAWVLASSSYATELLMRDPEAVTLLAGDAELGPRDPAGLRTEAVAAARRHDTPEQAVAAVRSLRRRELLRTAVADLLGLRDVPAVGDALTAVTAATLEAALDTATRTVGGTAARVAVIGMGRFGGHESGYGSDADVLFVYEPAPGVPDGPAATAAHAIAEELRRLLAIPASDPPLRVDADLRPEGRAGPLVRSLGSYTAYYARWSQTWESQALIRAEPVAGDRELGARFVALIDRYRWPDGGVDDAGLVRIRRLKARMEAERLPRGADPALHTKLGPGGLSDVEWTAQLVQLRHAHAVPALRTPRTLAALDAAVSAGLLDAADAETLGAAWRLATRIRGGVMLTRGRAEDSIPRDSRQRARLARAIGYPAERVPDLVEDYLRAARRARRVMERIFYDG